MSEYSFRRISICAIFLCFAISGGPVSAKCAGISASGTGTDWQCLTQEFMDLLCSSDEYMNASGLVTASNGSGNCQITRTDGGLQCGRHLRIRDLPADGLEDLYEACQIESQAICENLREWVASFGDQRSAQQVMEKNMVDANCGL